MNIKIDFEGVEDIKIDKLEITSYKNEKLKKKEIIPNTRKEIEENLSWENAEWKNIGEILKKPLSVAVLLLLIIIIIIWYRVKN